MAETNLDPALAGVPSGTANPLVSAADAAGPANPVVVTGQSAALPAADAAGPANPAVVTEPSAALPAADATGAEKSAVDSAPPPAPQPVVLTQADLDRITATMTGLLERVAVAEAKANAAETQANSTAVQLAKVEAEVARSKRGPIAQVCLAMSVFFFRLSKAKPEEFLAKVTPPAGTIPPSLPRTESLNWITRFIWGHWKAMAIIIGIVLFFHYDPYGWASRIEYFFRGH